MSSMSRVAIKYMYFDLHAFNRNDSPITISEVDIAALPPNTKPDSNTVWVTRPIVNDEVGFLCAGYSAPAAAQRDVTIQQGGTVIWARVRDVPEVDVEEIGRISAF